MVHPQPEGYRRIRSHHPSNPNPRHKEGKRGSWVAEPYPNFTSLFLKKEKVIKFAKSIIDGAKGVSESPKLLLITLVSTWALWLVHFVGFYLIFKAFNHSVPVTIVLLGAMIVSLTYMLPAAPGYVGTYEAYWTLTFLGLGLTQIDLLLAMGLVSHLIGLITTITLGCTGIIWLGLSFEEVFKIHRPERSPS